MTAGLELRLFGGLEIQLDGAPVSTFISNKAQALLAYLAVVKRPVQRDTLAALFWGELAEADAKNNLRQVLTNLRKQLDLQLDITRESVALRSDPPCRVDVADFLRGFKTAQQPAEQIAQLAASVALYHGDFLEGVILRDAPDFEEWALAQRTRYRELALNALHDLVDLQMAEGDYTAAIDNVTRLLALDPWREEAHRQLMLALARTGRRSAALAAYEQCRRIMREVFAAEPAEETAALAAQVKAALRGPRHNLTPPIDDFVGRADELHALRRLLANPAARLLTLTGPGGVGKTRLALQAAQERIDYHLGGVWFVSLAPVDDAASVAAEIAAALHLPLTGAKNLVNQLTNYLRDRDALLILDDFERVLAPASLDLITRLLAGAPQLRIVVTSRARLQLRAERVLEIGGLPYPVRADAPDADQFAAIQLFVGRAQHQHDAFTMAAQNRAAIVRICQTVDGMPLALELAATWTRSLAPHEILAEIERGMDILATTMRDAPPRHRSMRAVFAASWQMLSPSEQQLFASAAIFRGGFDTTAAQAVADATPALLAGLVDKSLLRRSADGRYRRHPLLLQFAEEQLNSLPELRADAAQRHINYFAQFLQAATPALYGPAQANALARIGLDMDNIRRAWHLAGEQRAFAFFGLALDPLMFVFDIAGLISEACDLCRAAHAQLAAPPGPGNAAERITLARVIALEGCFEFRVGAFTRARILTEEALTMLLAENAPPWNLGHAHTFLGGAHFGLGDLARTLAEFHCALDAYTEAKSAWGIATALGNIAEMHLVMGDESLALDYARRAHLTAEPTGNAYLLTHNAYRLAVLLANTGDYAAARRYQQESLTFAQQLDYQSGVGLATASLGDIAFALGDFVAAEHHFAAAVELHREAGNWMDEARYLVRQAEAALALAQFEACRGLLHTALRRAIQADAVAVQMDSLVQVARLWLQQRRTAEAMTLLRSVADHPASSVGARTLAVQLLAAHNTTRLAPRLAAAAHEPALAPVGVLAAL